MPDRLQHKSARLILIQVELYRYALFPFFQDFGNTCPTNTNSFRL